MTIYDQINDEKLSHDIKREIAKISALSPGKVNKYEYLTDEKISLFYQKQIIEQAKFSYSPLGKIFFKKIENQRNKQADALKSLEFSENKLPSIKDFISKERLNPEIMSELERIQEEKKS